MESNAPGSGRNAPSAPGSSGSSGALGSTDAPRLSELELYCPTIACGDPIPVAQIAAGPLYGAPVIVAGGTDVLPRMRRRMIYLGANFLRTRFWYMCPVCSLHRTFTRNWWTGAISEVHGLPPQADDGGNG